MGSLLIKNAQIISMNEQNDIFTGDIFIKDDLLQRLDQICRTLLKRSLMLPAGPLFRDLFKHIFTYARRSSAAEEMILNYWIG
jgi:hypothetical protein